ncbi:hypothetical protein KP509_24G033500 [Ceratopteris richardii]|uniref:EF-hand domain-containing protein n=1 Tax=Ceratopteris richardii TaxID=49495 RepID=A0A8T2RTS6_CERRI|nr:hypothetical protein KP509_24G033500 [Ceratopteris richardii]
MHSNRKVIGPQEEKERRIIQAFQVLDRDGDGSIGCQDLSAFFCGCLRESLSQEEAASMIASADANGDGFVGLDEFRRLLSASSSACESETLLMMQQCEAERSALRGVFDVLDINKDGLLSHGDLRLAMEMSGNTVSEKEVQSMFELAGVASLGSDTIDFEAFVTLMSSLSF